VAQTPLFQADTLHLLARDQGQMELEGLRVRAVRTTLRGRAKVFTWLGRVDYLELDMADGSELLAPLTGFGRVNVIAKGPYCSAHLNGATLARMGK
jgi:hypothetical protein